jgi:division protein CdvB (Snf7/Vps24/ESCRT-III family)
MTPQEFIDKEDSRVKRIGELRQLAFEACAAAKRSADEVLSDTLARIADEDTKEFLDNSERFNTARRAEMWALLVSENEKVGLDADGAPLKTPPAKPGKAKAS